jgi:monoterpene epsilon-lactone hydrolase
MELIRSNLRKFTDGGNLSSRNVKEPKTKQSLIKWRKMADELILQMSFPVRGIIVEPFQLEHLKAAWVYPQLNASFDKILIYFHGGGFMFGSLVTHQNLVSKIAKAANLRILFVEYRLSPEVKFPVAEEDCLFSYLWVLKNYPKAVVGFAGDSAGGCLALRLTLILKEKQIKLPACVVGISPVTNLMLSKAVEGSYLTNDKYDYIRLTGMLFMVEVYLSNEEEKKKASPYFGNLSGFPPLLIQSGDAEILLDDNMAFVRKARESGVNVTHQIAPNCIHVFQAFGMLIKESREYIQKIAEFVQVHMTKSRL